MNSICSYHASRRSLRKLFYYIHCNFSFRGELKCILFGLCDGAAQSTRRLALSMVQWYMQQGKLQVQFILAYNGHTPRNMNVQLLNIYNARCPSRPAKSLLTPRHFMKCLVWLKKYTLLSVSKCLSPGCRLLRKVKPLLLGSHESAK